MSKKAHRRPPGGDRLARRLHINKQMLIRFERDGLVSPKRNRRGHRIYSSTDIRKIKKIIRFMDEGRTLEQICEIMSQKDTV